MRHFIQSFGWAGKGLSAVWREERNFRVEVVIGILAVIAGFIREFSAIQWLFLVFAIALVILGEIVNTVVEDLCDIVEPNQNPLIGKVKDMMAGYVLVSSVVSVIVGLFIFLA